MAPTFPSVDNATLKALRKGDASALQRIHRAAYDTLIAATPAGWTATRASARPRSELAMLQLWETRGNIENAEELDSRDPRRQLRGGVTREQRRRAASKEHGEGRAAARWTRRGRTSPPRSPRRRRPPERGSTVAVKHHVENVEADGGRGGDDRRRRRCSSSRRRTAATALSAVERPRPRDGVLFAPGREAGRGHARASAANLPLGPGDTAAIGSDSKVTVGGDYGAKVRAVQVDGSANFRVSNGPRFEVDAKDVSLVTNGGSFAVRAYKDDPGGRSCA